MIAEIVRHSAQWETKQTYILEAKVSGFEEILGLYIHVDRGLLFETMHLSYLPRRYAHKKY